MGKEETRAALQAIAEVTRLRREVTECNDRVSDSEEMLRDLLDRLHDWLTNSLKKASEDFNQRGDANAAELKAFLGDIEARYEARLDSIRVRLDAQEEAIESLVKRMTTLERNFEGFQFAQAMSVKRTIVAEKSKF